MCELRSTRVQTDRVLSVPGRRLLASRLALGRCLAPSSSPACRLLASQPRPGRCLAPISCPAADCLHPAASWQVPGTGFQSCPQIASIPPRLGQVPGTDLAAEPRLGQVPGTDFLPGPQIAGIPPRLGQVPGTDLAGTDLAAVSIRSGRSPKRQWIRRARCLTY